MTCEGLKVPEFLQTRDTGFVDNAAAACPFCRSRKQHVYEVDVSVWAVYCTQCHAIGPHTASMQDAIARWASPPNYSTSKDKRG